MLLLFLFAQVSGQPPSTVMGRSIDKSRSTGGAAGRIITGAEQISRYLPLLKGRGVGMMINQSSVIDGKRSVDLLLSRGIRVVRLFGPEHGFTGRTSAARPVANAIDEKTGIPVCSLFGDHYKPTPADLAGIDVMIFDIQDVGVRFYTYLSSLHYMMEACAENGVLLVVLDRPNPNDFYVDGPVLDPAYRSFIGVDPIPVVHGVTFGEYACMVNGEGWLKNKEKCRLKVITMKNYRHGAPYILPMPPSPNLRDQQAVLLYPSLCFFGGTRISDARGTWFPFEAVGCPAFKGRFSFSFKPVPIRGMSEHPPLMDQVCYGLDLRHYDTRILRKTRELNIAWMISLYDSSPDKKDFFLRESTADSSRIGYHFDELAGTDQLRRQIIAGESEAAIRRSWEPGLSRYKAIRKKYLLYP